MSFPEDTRNELARGVPERDCCQRALLLGILMGQARLEGDEGGTSPFLPSLGEAARVGGQAPLTVRLETPSNALVRLLLRLLRRFGAPPMRWQARRCLRFREQLRYHVRIGPLPHPQELFAPLGLQPHAGASGAGEVWRACEMNPPLIKRRCCKRAYLRGAFLAGGSVGHPSQYYHLEWVARSALHLEVLIDICNDLDLKVAHLRRRYHEVLYLKGAPEIARALTLMGATRSLLYLEEVRAVKETKNQVRRRVNCETANLARTMQAAVRQVAEIRLLQARIGLKALPDPLRAVARLRLRHPEASLAELGRRLDPPMTKVAVSRCLRRLAEMAQGLRPDGRAKRGAPGVASESSAIE